MQVLVLAVQNSVGYQDLGVATSGATLFRSIGGAVGTAILGSIFSNRLKTNLASALVHLHPPVSPVLAKKIQAGADNPAALKALPPTLHSAYIHAFTTALTPVFLVAAGAAAVAFLLSLILEERPLRDSVTASSGIGESFAVPKDTESLAEMSRALGLLIGQEGRRRVAARWVHEAGLDLSPAAAWLLARLNENPRTDLGEVSARFDIPREVTERGLHELIERGMVVEAPTPDGTAPAYLLTPAGKEAVEKLIAARRAGLARLLEGWSPEQHVELAHLLTRLAKELVGERPVEAHAPT
jgi:DNA-binding MarR family transcriptional regulator